LLQYNVDGAIVASSMLPAEFAEACADARLPVVQAFGRPRRGAKVNIVGADNVQGGELAGDLLRAGGYRNIAFLGGPQTATSTQDRLVGLRASLHKAGIAPVAAVYGHSYSHEAGSALMRQFLKGGGVDAVFCGDDILAMGALDACREAGLGVPADIGIVGFNDIAMAAWPAYNLTTIRQPIGEIIVTAVEMVLKIVAEPERGAESRVFRCESVVRGTLRSTAG
jgi:DNA-binding LacI/PurR family transcriptional regulator